MKNNKIIISFMFISFIAFMIFSGCEKEDESDNNENTVHELDIETITVNGGSFEMGCGSASSDCEEDELPVHTVTVGDFQISKYEITNQKYAEFMNSIGVDQDGYYSETLYIALDEADCLIEYSDGKFISETGKENFPVAHVTWNGANKFCTYYGGRLPTEAEWEFAARGGKDEIPTKYAGSDNIYEVAWFGENSGDHCHEAGDKDPNELGIYDMTGNLYEWCNDWYAYDYYDNSTENNPQGPSDASFKVVRGGCYDNQFAQSDSRLVQRAYNSKSTHKSYIGFRYAKD